MTTPTYPDAPESLISHWEKRRSPIRLAKGEALADMAVELAVLTQRNLPIEPPEAPENASRQTLKEYELRRDLAGKSELALLHGLVIAHLRKRSFPNHAPALFHRIWAEESAHLLETLSTRWLISAVITFGEHGATASEQALGREMGMLFSIMKLYEFERLHSGKAPDELFDKPRSKAEMPLGMTQFSLANGGLDINLLAPVWQRAEAEPVMGPLACRLLERLNEDPGTLFRRISTMRTQKQAQIAAKKALNQKP